MKAVGIEEEDIDKASVESLRAEVRRLRGVIERNRAGFEDVVRKGNEFRERAVVAERVIVELQRIAAIQKQPSDLDLLFETLKRFVKQAD
jgi:hypothetical protein